ncbi:MAG: YggS family pyridoxal phosphate-dependent enzyme [Terriglobia bacterium]
MASNLRDNIQRVRERIARACERAGRRADDVRLIAISKTFSAQLVREAYDTGLREFGENRVQEAAQKLPGISDLGITWHLVGHLQSNKAKRATEFFQWVHSVDSVRLAAKLDEASAAGGAKLKILLEVNLGTEEAKSGLAENVALEAVEAIRQRPNLDLRGLMAIPPFSDDPEASRSFFRQLRELAEGIRAAGAPNFRELSMGMSHDFEIAIEEGATMIRVGTAIFGARE